MNIKNFIKSEYKKCIFEKFGYVLMIERLLKNYHGQNDFWLFQWIQIAIAHNQLEVFFAEDDTPIGFIAWAFLEADVQTKLIDNPAYALHPSEWTESTQPWIVDCVALPGFYKRIIRVAAQTFLKEYPQIGYVRRRLNGNKVALGKMRNKFYTEVACESL